MKRRFPKGMDGEVLWAPYEAARSAVERYPQGAQEAPSGLDWIDWDETSKELTLGLAVTLPSRCPRFAGRACPRMLPMGHENEHETCNYWDWAGMEAAAPGVELYPEWQRFDCHKYYPLFQNHLVGEALAQSLGATPRWVLQGPPELAPLLKVYAGFTSKPDHFSLVP
jgi:hypothetical protein